VAGGAAQWLGRRTWLTDLTSLHDYADEATKIIIKPGLILIYQCPGDIEG